MTMQPAPNDPGQDRPDNHARSAGKAAAGQRLSDAHTTGAGGGSSLIERRPITDRAEWLQWRLSDVTASDVSALFGVHPYGRTALSVWAEKSGLTEGLADSPILRRGRWAEPAVLAMLADERPTWQIRPAKIYLRDPLVRLGGTPDAVAIDPERPGVGLVQLKTATERVYERDWLGGEPPIGYQLQALTEAMLAGASWAAIAALIMDASAGWEPVIFDLARHEQAEERIRARVARFWSDLEAGMMPAVDPELDAETVAAVWPKALIKVPALDLSGDNALSGMLTTRATLARLAKDAGKQIDAIETAIKAKLGVHERAEAPGWAITWKNQHRDAYTAPPADFRVLRIKPTKER
jgi:predicted phage-related endonuclease